MKAALFYGAKDIRVEEVPEPDVGEDEVLIDVQWCGICGTDMHEYLMGPMVIPSRAPHPLTKQTLPVILGHEFCGRVLKAPSMSKLEKGDPVMVDPRLYCRNCANCKTPNTHGCATWGFLGLSGKGGGMASSVAVRHDLCYKLPEEVDLGLAALIEPLAVAWRGMKVSGVQNWSETSALILGGGPIGQAMLRVLRAKGATQVIVSEPTAARQEQAKSLATKVLDPTKENVSQWCQGEIGSAGVDVVFDCAGVEHAMKDGFDSLRFQGTYVNVASWETPFTIPTAQFMLKEVTIKASMAYNDEDFRETVDAFCAGKFERVEDMVSGRIELKDIVSKGFEELISNKDRHIKILVRPDRDTM